MKTQNIDVSKETIADFCQQWHITKLSLFGSVLPTDAVKEGETIISYEKHKLFQ